MWFCLSLSFFRIYYHFLKNPALKVCFILLRKKISKLFEVDVYHMSCSGLRDLFGRSPIFGFFFAFFYLGKLFGEAENRSVRDKRKL